MDGCAPFDFYCCTNLFSPSCALESNQKGLAVIPWTPPGNSTHMPQTLALVTEDSTNVTRLELLFQVKLHAMKPTTLSCFDHTFIYHPHQKNRAAEKIASSKSSQIAALNLCHLDLVENRRNAHRGFLGHTRPPTAHAEVPRAVRTPPRLRRRR